VSICKAYGRKIDRADYTGQIEEIAGFGVKAQIEDKSVWVGSRKLMGGIERPDVSVSGTIVFVAIDGSYVGHIIIADKLKPDSAQTIRDLRNMGVKRIIMLTGDCEKISEEIAEQIELDCAYSELLPHEKVSKLEELAQDRTTNGKLVFVGDGINDAPVLARADVGIAMGALGSDAAIEAADIVLMTDEPSKVVTAIQIARKTRRIARQNIICALGTKAVILVLGALGIATMWGAVFGDVGVSIIAILNAVRAMRIQRR
jgi:Cd2+/Zn2+-exporting ATPase